MDDTVSTWRRFCGLALALALLACLPVGSTGCAHYIGTTARSYLNTIEHDPDPNVRYLAYSKLGSPQLYDKAEQKAEAVKKLVEKLDGSKEPTASRAVICRTLGELGDPNAREALIGQPKAIQRFLRRTAVLDQLCGPLCEAVVGSSAAAMQLRRIEAHNLFVTPLDRRRQWYRYHSLFATRATFPACLEVTAESTDGVIMGVRHRDLPIEAVQFHPESILTAEDGHGLKLMENAMRLAKASMRAR